MTKALRKYVRLLVEARIDEPRALLKDYIKNVIAEGGLTPSEMRKVFKDQVRLTNMIDQLKSGAPFELTSGKTVVFDDSGKIAELAAAIEAGDEAAYKAIMAGGLNAQEIDDDGNPVKNARPISVTSMGQILKTKAFGSSKMSPREKKAAAASGKPVKLTGTESEGSFAGAINAQIEQNDGKPITISLGGRKFSNVTGATGVGTASVAGETSKADVILSADGTTYGLSLKMPSAEYYLSGDYVLGDIVQNVLKNLTQADSAQKYGVSVNRSGVTKQSKTGATSVFQNALVDSNGKLVNVKFPLSKKAREEAVFGRGANKVDFIVKGDLDSPPTKLADGTLQWNVSLIEADLSQIPEEDQPVGLLRHAAGRGVEGFKGIRPVVVTASRAKDAIDVSSIFGLKSALIKPQKIDDDASEPPELAAQILREPKRKKQETK